MGGQTPHEEASQITTYEGKGSLRPVTPGGSREFGLSQNTGKKKEEERVKNRGRTADKALRLGLVLCD